MSQVIQFLESIGGKPSMSPMAYVEAVDALNAGMSQKRALLERDGDALNGLLGGRKQVLCAIFAAEED